MPKYVEIPKREVAKCVVGPLAWDMPDRFGGQHVQAEFSRPEWERTPADTGARYKRVTDRSDNTVVYYVDLDWLAEEWQTRKGLVEETRSTLDAALKEERQANILLEAACKATISVKEATKVAKAAERAARKASKEAAEKAQKAAKAAEKEWNKAHKEWEKADQKLQRFAARWSWAKSLVAGMVAGQ